MKKIQAPPAPSKRLAADLELIQGPYIAYLRGRHSAEHTIAIYQRLLIQIGCDLDRRAQSLSALTRDDVARLISHRCSGRKPATRRVPQAALHAWLKFRDRFRSPTPQSPRQSWLDDYASFLEKDRGLAACTCDHYSRIARCYLKWQFGDRAPRWADVHPRRIWAYTSRLQRAGRKAKGVSDDLSSLRQFLRFVHLRGAAPATLPQSVPTIADRGRSVCREVISEKQRRRLLRSFDRKSAEGRRDFTMALCMIDLGLRRIEVVRLRLGDVDLVNNVMAVPPAKASRGRAMPLAPHVADALRTYIKHRPATPADFLFVGHAKLIGRPLSPCAVSAVMDRAYRRCGFRWHGTHRLRHSFATRLYARGANTKEIADLLGHRLVMTTDRYTQVGRDGLGALVRPWPTN